MNWTIIIYVLIPVVTFLGGLFIKNFFPSYMDEKGKNLATKEDIQEITRKTEEVKKEFEEKMQVFSSDVKFKYDFRYKQYSGLYSKLYAVVIQSEYIRLFIDTVEGNKVSFDDAPFLEISPTEKRTGTLHVEGGKSNYEIKVDVINTPISQFNKILLSDCIIENGALASQELLKIAVSYRFAYEYYSGNKSGTKVEAFGKIPDEEEFRLIREMVCCIVKDYNVLRKSLNMSYDDEELVNGIPKLQQN